MIYRRSNLEKGVLFDRKSSGKKLFSHNRNEMNEKFNGGRRYSSHTNLVSWDAGTN